MNHTSGKTTRGKSTGSTSTNSKSNGSKSPNGKSLKGYGVLLGEIKERIRSAQYEALRAVNSELIELYWDIGRMIVERQKKGIRGKEIAQRLARDLQIEFPGIRGFSQRNIWYMRKFYLTYEGNSRMQSLIADNGWTHNIIVMEKCKDALRREFYLRMNRKFGWTVDMLAHHIDNQTYEKTLLNQVNFEKTLPKKVRQRAKLAVRDEYSFDFLELGEEHGEREFERAAVARIERFLSEMGGLFLFAGSQYRLEVGGDEFFIDILLYNRALKCLVALELKVGKFQPEFVGKMQFYLAALDDLVRLPHENLSIGIIICREKNRTVVEYALRESTKPIGVAAYRVVRALPSDLEGQLPNPEQVMLLMEEVE